MNLGRISASRRKRGRTTGYLVALAAAGLLAVLGVWAHYLQGTLETVRGYQGRLEALEDSVRTAKGPDSRVPLLEHRVAGLEKRVSFNDRAARVPEVIALRRWVQRLDAMTLRNARRIAQFERSTDSTLADVTPTDSVSPSTSSLR